MIKTRRLIIIACLACLIILLFPQRMEAAQNDSAQLKKEKTRLLEMKAREEKTAAQLSEALQKEKLGKKRISELKMRLEKQKKLISSIDRRLLALSGRHDEIEKQMRGLAKAHDETKNRLLLTEKLAFEKHRLSLAHPSAASYQERPRILMSGVLAAGVQDVKRLSMAWESKQKELSGIEQQVAISEKKMAQEQKTGEQLLSRQEEEQKRLSDIEKEKQAKQKELSALRESIKRMESLVAAVERKAREKEEQRLKKSKEAQGKTPPPRQTPRFASLPDGMSAPLSGRVVTRFGKQRDEKFDVMIENNGVELEAESGANVKAAASGEAAFTGAVSGYGNVIILQHAPGLFSVYGKLDSFLVKTGQKVSRGDVVGRLPQSPSGKSVLYFELRAGGAAVDPVSVISFK